MPHQHDEISVRYYPMFIGCLFITCLSVYWESYDFFYEIGWVHAASDKIFSDFAKAGLFTSHWKLKLIVVPLLFWTMYLRTSKKTDTPWSTIITFCVISVLIYLVPPFSPILYIITCGVGFLLMCAAFALLSRKLKAKNMIDEDDSFLQCDEKIETEYSINIPTRYRYQHRTHKGWINIVNPFRSVIIFGTPGSGKSFSIVWPIMETMLQKCFSMLVYDYKMPDLTDIVYNKYLQTKDRFKEKYGKEPKFCLINFNDPRQSMRCNPLDAKYLTDKSDAFEVADILMKNMSSSGGKDDGFFEKSAKAFIAAYVWLLKGYKHGIYCTFPHLIELMGMNYKAVLEILQQNEDTRTIVQSFVDAMKDGAQEQLQGQIASARIPMLEFDSAALYWTLTGNDFSLDINNVDDPKILCVGNDPKRQSVYGPALALYMSRIIRTINAKTNLEGKRNIPCGVIFDEFPTIYVKGIDNLIDTARSNKVCVTLACQDKSQINRDYGDKEADVVFNSPGTVISGQVNGTTARTFSETFGREFRMQQSTTSGGDSETTSISYQQQEILPQSKIETLSNGVFFGKVADDTGHEVKRKLFCGKVHIDVDARLREQKEWKKLPNFGARYFNDDKIREEICRTEESKMHTILEFMLNEKQIEERRKQQKDKEYSIKSDAALLDVAGKEYDAMEPSEREKILDKAILTKQDAAIREKLLRNVDQIRLEVMSIFESYGIDPMNYSEGSNGQEPLKNPVGNTNPNGGVEASDGELNEL